VIILVQKLCRPYLLPIGAEKWRFTFEAKGDKTCEFLQLSDYTNQADIIKEC